MHASTRTESLHDHDYDAFLAAVRDTVGTFTGPVFTTGVEGLWRVYLGALPAEHRQHYTCHTCQRFVDAYGGLVTIDEDGCAYSIWPDIAPGVFSAVAATLRARVKKAKVTGVFLSSEPAWGIAQTGAWSHLAAPSPSVFKATALRTAFQTSAEKREDYGMLCRGLADYDAATVAKALTLLSADALYRSEKCEGVAKWLSALHQARAGLRGKARDNVTWRAVATAPAGFCHVRSTIIGTLLDDIAANKPMAAAAKSFAAKMHPLQYQRPTALPSDGQIAAAEKVVAALQSQNALARRFARLADIETAWTPRPVAPAKGGVFGHLSPAAKAESRAGDAPTVSITFEKFMRTVPDDAVVMECLVPGTGAFYALVTAADPSAPPVIQWDREEKRNPVTWYTYSGGGSAHQWNVPAGQWHPVTAISYLPFMWHGVGYDHQGEGAIFVLDGCRDTTITAGAGFFPEQLKSEYHGIRATMEAFARSATIAGREQASACGLAIRKGQRGGEVRVRVTSRSGARVVYCVDRWD